MLTKALVENLPEIRRDLVFFGLGDVGGVVGEENIGHGRRQSLWKGWCGGNVLDVLAVGQDFDQVRLKVFAKSIISRLKLNSVQKKN